MVTLSKETQQRGRKTPAQKSAEDEFVGQELVPTNGGGNGHALVAAGGFDLVTAENETPEWAGTYQSTGAGVSDKAQDNLIPMATLIQVNAKRANSAEASYIPGAEAGMVYIPALEENALVRCRKGRWGNNEYNENGLLIQPCFQKNSIVEWGARVGGAGGGFKGAHPLINDDVAATMEKLGAQLRPDPQNPDKKIWMRDNRVFVETRQWAGHLFVEKPDADDRTIWRPTGELLALSFNFKSTEHTFAKDWNSKIRRRYVPGSNQKSDMWLGLWRLTTHYRSDHRGSWYEWRSDWVGFLKNPTYIARGAELYQAFMSGEKEMAADDAVDTTPGSNDSSQYQDREVM